jgi:hypothetical protein
MYTGPVSGFLDWVFESFLPRFDILAHYVLNEWYRVDGDSAEGETHRISYHRPADGSDQRFAACRTFNRYECRDGIWKIAHRSVVRDWVVDTPFVGELLGGSFEFPMSRSDGDDVSYVKLASFGRGPLS